VISEQSGDRIGGSGETEKTIKKIKRVFFRTSQVNQIVDAGVEKNSSEKGEYDGRYGDHGAGILGNKAFFYYLFR